MNIVVDLDLCVGGGQCVLAAPELFDQDDDGLAIILNEHPDASQLEAAELAVRICPARAIHVTQ